MNATLVLDEEEIDENVSPADPLDVPKGFELIDGVLVEKPEMGYKSSWVAGEIFFLLRSYLATNPIGVATTAEASFACFPGRPNLVRKPDVAVILCDLRTFVPPDVASATVPAVFVEVVSPSDTISRLDDKILLFLGAGTKLVWVVDPVLRTVIIHRADGTIARLRDPAELSGEDVLPGFRVALAAFLPPLPIVETTS